VCLSNEVIQGIPYVSAIDNGGDNETSTFLALQLILIMIEYKPPSIDNLSYLIRGGHPSLKRIYNFFLSKTLTATTTEQEAKASAQAILDDLTINEYYRLLRVVHGKINLDPLYTGLS